MKIFLFLIAFAAVLLVSVPARADFISATYTQLAEGTTIDLTATGTLDWAKFGNGDSGTDFFVATKIGNPVISPIINPVGTAPDGYSVALTAVTGFNVLNFTWTDGNFGMYNTTGPVDTVVTETLTPSANSYPTGLGASFTALASDQLYALDVYVQGFDSDMVLNASLSGGASTSMTVSPTASPTSDPNNVYSIGVYHILYSGAGETLTFTTTADGNPVGAQSAFPNAGIFAAAVAVAAPEPASATLLVSGLLGAAFCAGKRRRARA